MTETTDENETVWLGIALGTRSVRALAVTADGTVLGRGSAPLGGRREGVRHEQDPGEWCQAVSTASRSALLTLTGVRIGGLAVCGTSGTVLLTDAEGRPTSPALMSSLVLKGATPTRCGTPRAWSATTSHRAVAGCPAGRRGWARARFRRPWTPGPWADTFARSGWRSPGRWRPRAAHTAAPRPQPLAPTPTERTLS
jgi:sugar (pentulose or hexulose) kinase